MAVYIVNHPGISEKFLFTQEQLASNPKVNRSKAFRTIVNNRMQRGGIMAAVTDGVLYE